jgi:hypothetical protein
VSLSTIAFSSIGCHDVMKTCHAVSQEEKLEETFLGHSLPRVHKLKCNTSSIMFTRDADRPRYTDLMITMAGRLDSQSLLHKHSRLAPSESSRRAVSSRSMIPPTCWTCARRRAHSDSRCHPTRRQVSSPGAAAAPRARRTPSATTGHRPARGRPRTRARRAAHARTLRAAHGTARPADRLPLASSGLPVPSALRCNLRCAR